MRRLAISRVGLAVALSLTLTSVSRGEEPATAVDQNGQAHAWQGPFERVTVLDFAASWCGPCRHTLPRLEAYAREHPEVSILVVSVDDKVEGRDQLVSSLDLTLPVLWDEGYAIANHYEPETLPTTVVLDREGEVIHRYLGSTDAGWEELTALLAEATK